MGDYLAFRKMITPVFIQVLFWIGVVAVVIGGIASIGSHRVGVGLALIILGPIGIRVYAEILIVVFRINDNVFAIRSGKEGAPPASSSSGP
jgi:hypothetical protein